MNKKLNFLVIITDQQRWDSLGCYGNKFVETPNIDKLAETGAKCANSFTPWPVCSPARATMWTGVYPHTHNIVKNVYDIDNAITTLSNESTTLFNYLQDEGYITSYFGKWHLGEGDPGFCDIWEGFNSLGSHWVDGIKDGQYKPDVQTDHCIEYLKKFTNKDRPFFMVQSYYPPHEPYTAPVEFYKPYRGKGVPFPGYYAAVSNIDYNVGRILDTLDETGLRDNTIVIYFSDHGETFCFREDDHHKFVCYDEAIRVPFIINWKGHIKPGLVLNNYIGLEDLMPTILDYLECEIPKRFPGRSIRPLLEEQKITDWRDFYYIENITHNNHYQQRSIRTKEWKLILSDGGPHACRMGPHFLYNLIEDPEEDLNLFNTEREDFLYENRLKNLPRYDDKIKELTYILREYAKKIDDIKGVIIAENVLKYLEKK